MVGIFARIAGGRSGHRRTKSAIEVSESLAPNVEAGGSTAARAASHGAEAEGAAFRPVEHPVEPLNRDQPVRCPLPEPSILNDGRAWKVRMSSASSNARTELPVVREGSQLESETGGTKPQRVTPRRLILPSISAPENSILTLLEECDASKSVSDW